MAKADVLAGRAHVSLWVKQDAFVRGLRSAQAKMQKFGSEMTAMGRQLVAMSAAGVVPMAMATKRFADFDDAMRMVKAVSQSTEQEFQQLTDTAKMLGATTSFTAVEVASLMTELGRAGFTADEINVMTAAVMNLARATGTDATLASGIMAASLRQFGLGADQASRVADVLTHAANATFNSVESLGESMKYAGPVAASLGMSLEDTAAILGTLGNVGIQGSEAGTALRRLSVISAATGKDLKAIFGISNVDAGGKLKPLAQIMGEIGTAVEKLPVAERVSKMNEAFGLLGITAATVMGKTAGDTAKLAEELRNAGGTAAKAAKEMDSGLGGAFRIIMSAAEGVAIELGNAISEPLQKAVKFGSDFLSVMVKVIKNNKETVIWFSKIALAVGAAGVALVAIGLTFTSLSVIVGGFASAITFAVAVLGGVVTAVGAVLSPMSVLIASLVAGAYAWIRFTESGRAAVAVVSGLLASISATFTETFSGIVDAIQNGDIELAGKIAMTGLQLVVAQGLEAVAAQWARWKESIVSIWQSLKVAWNGIIDGIVDTWFGSIASMEDFFARFVDTVTGEDSAANQKARDKARADMAESLREERQARDAVAGGAAPGVSRGPSPEVARLRDELTALRMNAAGKVAAMAGGESGRTTRMADGSFGESTGGGFGSGDGKASAAMFSAAGLLGNTAAGGGTLQAMLGTKKAVEQQTQKQKAAHDELLAAIKTLGLHHP